MTLEKIIAILAEYKEINAADMNAETTFESINLDSLDIVEIMMKLEDELNVTIEINPDIKTVGKLAEYIDSLL
ncbi:MAG: acyl carrier protein [Eubacteriales bacterium]